MNELNNFAMIAAKEITVAAVQQSNGSVLPWKNGEMIASFFETVYRKIREIEQSSQDI